VLTNADFGRRIRIVTSARVELAALLYSLALTPEPETFFTLATSAAMFLVTKESTRTEFEHRFMVSKLAGANR